MPALVPGYHIGIVVANLDHAMSELSENLGVEWHTPFPAATDLLVDGETVRTVAPRLVYSKQGPPYLEILEQVPDTIWAEPGLHHIGFWADDALTESHRLAIGGLPLLQRQADVGTGAPVCYHQTSDGVRLELVDIGLAGPSIAAYLSGAADARKPL